MIDLFSAGPRGTLAIAAAGVLALGGFAAAAGAASADPVDGIPSAGARAQLVRVSTPTPQAKVRLSTLGLDLTESAGPGYIDVVLHDASEAGRLRRTGLGWQVRVADLGADEKRARQADQSYAAKNAVSPLPSGRTSYRTLGDYEAEMATLARRHRGLVRMFTLPRRTLEGRKVRGIEIGHRVRTRDGRPVFLMMGLHHSREWPSGELDRKSVV